MKGVTSVRTSCCILCDCMCTRSSHSFNFCPSSVFSVAFSLSSSKLNPLVSVTQKENNKLRKQHAEKMYKIDFRPVGEDLATTAKPCAAMIAPNLPEAAEIP